MSEEESEALPVALMAEAVEALTDAVDDYAAMVDCECRWCRLRVLRDKVSDWLEGATPAPPTGVEHPPNQRLEDEKKHQEACNKGEAHTILAEALQVAIESLPAGHPGALEAVCVLAPLRDSFALSAKEYRETAKGMEEAHDV